MQHNMRVRRVADPNGVAWSVDVSWTDIRFGSRFYRLRARRDERRRARAEGKAGSDGGAWFETIAELVGSLDNLVLVVVAVVAALFAILFFPWLLAFFLDFVLILIFPLLAIAVIAWRAARRRPFTITAERSDRRDDLTAPEWRVVGVREARRLERAVADAIVAGGDPDVLFPEYVEPFPAP
jgi:hypothetical protein